MSTVAAWLAAFDETAEAASLINHQARQVAAFLHRYASDICSVIECRRDAERELIVLDFLTGAPQAPVYPIHKTERVGILFIGEGGRLPFVVMLRDDFPDTEHQQIVPPDHPHVICIDDRPWAEARLTWTPAELVERILSWFRRAARGELQDVRQPLDPIFMVSSLRFVVARSILDAGDVADLIGEYDPGVPNTIRVRRATEVGKITPGMDPITIFSYRVPPERMKRLRYAPTSLAAIPANLFDPGEGGAAVEHALSEADIIIDATASLVAARKLSDHPSKARRMSAFFNPSGESAVLLAEPENRAVTLRDLEAQYLALVLRTPRLADHLGKLAETIAYTGACRAITNRIPEWRATILSGLAAGGIGYAADTADGMISIWTLAPTGEVSLDTAPVEPVGHYQAMDWTITINAGLADRIVEMRNSRLPAETGGILFGLVDIPAKSIHLVMATPAPSDSIEEPGGFVRGMGGVDEMTEDVRRRTAGQVRYVGEWHSHPPQASARPSSTDGRQLDWLAALMGMDSMPALMLIAADRELLVIFATRRAEPSSAQLGS